MARFAAVLFGAAALVTVLGLLLPHQPEVDETGLAVTAGLAGVTAVGVALWGEEAPDSVFALLIALGTVVVSLALLFNGERHDGAAGGDEMYYLWVVTYSAYYLGRRTTAVQVLFVAVVYGITLVAIDPGEVATSRWLSTVGLVVGSAIVVRMLSERIEGLLARLEVAAHTDSLTGLANRLAFDEACDRELSRAARRGSPPALLLADLDQLKDINDRFGHQAGDDAIIAVGRILETHLRNEDFPARIGGDEFAVLLPATGAEAARNVGERLSRALCELGPTDRSLGMSFGIAVPGEDGDTRDELMSAADEALYVAKRANAKAAGRTHRQRRVAVPVTTA